MISYTIGVYLVELLQYFCHVIIKINYIMSISMHIYTLLYLLNLQLNELIETKAQHEVIIMFHLYLLVTNSTDFQNIF